MAIDVIVQHEGQHEDGAHRCMTMGNEPTIVVGFNMLPAPSKGAPCPRLIRSTTPSLTPPSANLRIVPRRQFPYAPQTMLTTGLPVSSQSTRRSTKALASRPSPMDATPSSSNLASLPMRTPDIGTARSLFEPRSPSRRRRHAGSTYTRVTLERTSPRKASIYSRSPWERSSRLATMSWSKSVRSVRSATPAVLSTISLAAASFRTRAFLAWY